LPVIVDQQTIKAARNQLSSTGRESYSSVWS